MRIEIPELCVVALVGVTGSGKTSFARQHFLPTEILSSDAFRAMLADDENDQSVTGEAFDALYHIADRRLSLGRLCVIDATNVQKESRARVLELARAQEVLAAAIVLDMPEALCRERNERRPDRNFGPHVISRQAEQLRRSARFLQKEGFRFVYVLKSEQEAAEAEIVRTKLWNDRREDSGPFDIIGDVHGCYDELCELLEALGYAVDAEARAAVPPEGRKAVFLGDLCDRGPRNVDVLKLVMDMVKRGRALAVPGNHDVKLLKKLNRRDVRLTHGLEGTVAELEAQPAEFAAEVREFLDGLVSHYVLDRGRLVVAHAGLKERLQGRASGRVRDFCLYGDTTGEIDEYGLPVRQDWAAEYRGRALVVYGHTPQPEVRELNRTVCIDTGCAFGGKLTALQYPENKIAQVRARRQYYAPAKPLAPPKAEACDLLDISDVLGERRIETGLKGLVRVGAEYSAAALEAMSRFAADPRWLIYLPPTMSPPETSKLPDYLEHPLEALEYYRSRGVQKVVCERKHMGSRAVAVVCRDREAARRRFGAPDGEAGILYTRTGRRFFEDVETERALLDRLRSALDRSGFWADFGTDWACLDAELMPWSAKARALLEQQYAPVGRAGRTGLGAAAEAIARAIETLGDGGIDVPAQSSERADLGALLSEFEARRDALARYADAYRRYCWDVKSLDDYRIAPFHILATEGKVWMTENHLWHMDAIARYVAGSDPVFLATEHVAVDLADGASVDAAVEWWLKLTGAGGEGMVVKPLDFIARRGNELLQPAVKCRGREYLRIIYGPEYLLGGNLERLRQRSLGRKRSLALNEFALGAESLERFVRGEPLRRVHECAFGVLALESEPVDPRL